jgi:nucleoside-diphosphate-sugar epimerase
MIALVSGARGFIGSHLVDRLRAAGAEVRTVARPLPSVDAYSSDAVWRGVTHVFHLAGLTRAVEPGALIDANVHFTERLAQAALQHARRAGTPVPHFVFVSSLAALGPATDASAPVTEVTAPAPVERYGTSKRQAESVLQRMTALPLTIVRPPAVYGPRDRDFLTVFRQVRFPLHLRAVPGWYQLTLTSVHDVVDALLAVARVAPHTHAQARAGYVVGGHDVRWEALYEQVTGAVHRVRGRGPRRSRGLTVPLPLLRTAGVLGATWGRFTARTPLATPDKITLGAQPYWLCRGDRLQQDTGWMPRVDLETGLAETAAWYADHGWLSASGVRSDR